MLPAPGKSQNSPYSAVFVNMGSPSGNIRPVCTLYVLVPGGKEMSFTVVESILQNRSILNCLGFAQCCTTLYTKFWSYLLLCSITNTKGTADKYSTSTFSICATISYSGRSHWDQNTGAVLPLFGFCLQVGTSLLPGTPLPHCAI